MISNKMNLIEQQAVFSLSLIIALRMVGLFMIMPIFALYAKTLEAATPFLIGLAIGIYGLTQGLLQIPFGILSDHLGRRPIIVLGLLLFALGSLIAALSSSIYGIILGRALQGSGAIGSTLLAFMADLTQEEHRSKAMAIAGMTIGLSFAIAMITGPLLAEWLPFQSLFYLAALLSGIAIIILYTATPKPKRLSWHPDTEPELKFFYTILKNTALLRLNSGIFLLHAILTANFLVLPISLNHYLGWQGHDQWMLYVPSLVLAFIIALMAITRAEKKRQVKPYFLAGIIGLASAEALLWLFPQRLWLTVIGLSIFLTAFSLLEAFLPSLVSRTAPAARKGTALGLYSCAQFLGIFTGGTLGGWLYQKQGLLYVYSFCFILALLWLGITYRMKPPTYLVTRILNLSGHLDQTGQANIWPELFNQLQCIPGIAEITFLPEEKVAYLKLENKALTHPDFLRIEKELHHPRQ